MRSGQTGTIIEVAPRAGAWIEIRSAINLSANDILSHPVRVRGLKFSIPRWMMRCVDVAPRAGAWIEICRSVLRQASGTSHPVRVRGLKYELRQIDSQLFNVAPRAGAWIEIITATGIENPNYVAPRAGAWIEIRTPHGTHLRLPRRTPCGCVD